MFFTNSGLKNTVPITGKSGQTELWQMEEFDMQTDQFRERRGASHDHI